MSNVYSLVNLGWQPFFQQQLSLQEWTDFTPARIIEQHKTEVALVNEAESFTLGLQHTMPDMVVGDWLLLDEQKRFVRLLERKTCFQRKAAGSKVGKQLIAANVDTAFIVCSMNHDFNLNRIERFLSLANDAGAEPVILLSKSDLAETPEHYIAQVQKLDNLLNILAINCLSIESTANLLPWVKEGNTVVVLGSSGVGKSTLVNALLGESKQSTGGTRTDDDKGRHTTSRRSLIGLSAGGMILDTPGMREVQLANCEQGISATFADIEQLAQQCRFKDCQHQGEPGCAVQHAIAQERLEQRRLDNYLKLRREEMQNSASLAEKRATDKALGKFYKRTITDSRKLKSR